MKKLILFSIFSLYISLLAQAQVMHSSNAMEYSIGVERFSQFVAKPAVFTGQFVASPEQFRLRPIFSARFKKNQESENYFAFGGHFAYNTWSEEVLASDVLDFLPVDETSIEFIFEKNDDALLGFSYQYSFLINKKKNSNFQFFIASGIDVYASIATKNPREFFFTSILRRNIVGGRISVLPELTYLIPNSRVSFSLRALIPVFESQRIDEELRQSTLSSFIVSSLISNTHSFLPLGRSRLELGFGYFLKSK